MITTVRGTQDLFGPKYLVYKMVSDAFQLTVRTYGFDRLVMPVIEDLCLYDNVGDTSDVVSKEMFFVKNRDSEAENMVLRPEGTMSCARYLINSGQINRNDVRIFYDEKMFRYCRPQRGRGREFIQLGCEVFNGDSVYTEAEMIECLYSFVKSLGVDFKLHINTTGNRDSLKRYTEVLGDFFHSRIECLSDINKSRLSKNILRVLDQLSNEEKALLSDGFPNILDYIEEEDRNRFSILCSTLKHLGVDFVVDQFIIRGLDYYDGCIFELVTKDYSIAGGGRYRLAKDKLGLDNDVVGFGWAIGYERLAEYISFAPSADPLYVIFALEDGSFALEVAQIIRNRLGKRVKIVFGSMKQCINRAKSMDPDYVVFCGSTEQESRLLKIKNWRSGEHFDFSLADPRIDF